MTLPQLASPLASHLAQVQMGPGSYMHGPGYGTGGGWGIWMLLQALLWIGLLVAMAFAVFVLVRGSRSGKSADQPGASALDLLDERYARGEIDREEYLQRKKDISER